MARSTIRVECAGNCGKFQIMRPSRVDPKWTYIGCGACEGWREVEASLRPVPDGMILVKAFQAVAGFEGLRLRMATIEERTSLQRARDVLDQARDQGLL